MAAAKPKLKRHKRRIPKLKFTNIRNIGWHVSFRDPKTGSPKKCRFGNISREEATTLYQEWLIGFLSGKVAPPRKKKTVPDPTATSSTAMAKAVPGSLLMVASSLIRFDEQRTRKDGEPRRSGTISKSHLECRRHAVRLFLQFMNERQGSDTAVTRLLAGDLTMHDVEAFNQLVAAEGKSARHVSKMMSVVKDIIVRAGRPEHNGQTLSWNWDSRDIIRGKAAKIRKLPTLEQLKNILRASDTREQAIIWVGIGLGFGQGDISAIRVGQIDKEGYDLRRGKTQIERYGETPPMVWKALSKYLKETPRPDGELLFVTRRGSPLVHGKRCDAIRLWWERLRKRLDETKETLSGFYILRHLGATEFGSRPGCSLADMRRWLGHTATSAIADIYMRPVAPEHRKLIEWVRKGLLTGKANLKSETGKGRKDASRK
jgi:integrase